MRDSTFWYKVCAFPHRASELDLKPLPFMLPLAFLGKWTEILQRGEKREKSNCERSVRCVWRTSLSNESSQPCHFHLCWRSSSSSSAGGHWVETRMLHRAAGGEELNVASCDLHNKIRISPKVFFCLLVALMEWAPLGAASLKGLPWVIRPAKGLGIKCAVKLMRSVH